MQTTLLDLWQSRRGVYASEVEPRIFMFQFFHVLDFRWAWMCCPWSFKNHLLVLDKISTDTLPQHVPLFFLKFWVQAHDVAGLMTEQVGKTVGDFIGSFVAYDPKKKDAGRKFKRVRARMDVGCL